MRQKIILLSGFGGTGKTTIGNCLYDLLESNALVEADELFHIKPFVIGDKMGRIKLRNTLDVMHNFLEERYHHVIVAGLVWSQDELDAVVREFPATKYDLFLFWLYAMKEARFQRVVNRAEPGDTLEWLEHVERTVSDPWPFRFDASQALAIDTTNQLPEQVTEEILRALQHSKQNEPHVRMQKSK